MPDSGSDRRNWCRRPPVVAATLVLVSLLGATGSLVLSDTGRKAKSEPAGLGRPAFRIHTDRDGLPQNVVECMSFDLRGYLWVGTQNGAAYYNGRRWAVVNLPNRAASNSIFTILAAPDGSMWFGTQSAGLARLKDGRWETFDRSNSGLPDDEVRSLLMIPGAPGTDELWIGTGSGGVARYKEGKWTRFSAATGALRSDNVRSLALTTSPQGEPSVWVGTLGGGLSRFENGRWTTFDTSNSGLSSNQIRCLVAETGRAGNPSLWVGTTGGGLVRYEAGRWTTLNTSNSGLPSDVVRSLCETVSPAGGRILWVGTNGNGLARFQDGRWTTYDTNNSALPKNAVLSLLGDPASSGEGIWIGTLDGGVAHYVTGGWSAMDTRNSGLPDSQVWSLLETASASGEPAFWFGTTGGLARFEAGRWTVFSSRNSALPGDYVLSLMETKVNPRERALWVGTNGAGLARFAAGKWNVFNTGNSALPDNFVQALLETRSGSGGSVIWAGTESGGLARYADGEWTAFRAEDSGLPDNKVQALVETRTSSGASTLWVGTERGLARYEAGRWTTFNTSNSGLPHNEVWGLRETVDESGRRFLWIGTAGGGAARLDLANPQSGWYRLSEATNPALPNDTVWQIRQDRWKRIYLYTDRGIAQLTPRAPSADNPAEYEVLTFNTADGLPGNGCNQGASLIDSVGRLWVGTGAGAAVFTPAAPSGNRVPRPLYIERTLVNSRDRSEPGRAGLTHRENNLQFEYALLNFFREEDTRYRFQLEGFDPTPSDWTADPRKEYTNLAEGTYTFRVWARDHAGTTAGPTAKTFSIAAAPWRTWWAYSVYALFLVAGVVATDRVQRRRLIRKERERSQLREAELRAETAEAQAQAIEAENRRKSEELNFARQLQLSMLPKENIRLDQVDIVGQMRTATEVGGDYYDFVKIDDSRYCLAIGDATGHGVGAGLVVGMVKTALLNSVLLMKPDTTAREMMVDINATLKATLSHRGVGMCFAIALLDIRHLTADLCSTGMPFPCLYENQTGRVRTFEMPGPPLGFMKKIKPHSHTVQLAPRDRLIFLSDGFHERMNAAGDCWGYETVAREIGRICAAEAGAEEVARSLISACDQFALERETDDDMTVIVVSVGEPPQESGA